MVLYILTFTFLDSRRDDKRLWLGYCKNITDTKHVLQQMAWWNIVMIMRAF
jgi:hypothetical protein